MALAVFVKTMAYQLIVKPWINAPQLQCFDLARSISAHLKSAAGTSERVINPPPNDLLELGDEVTWQGRHFGVTQRLTSRITGFSPPAFFQDRMIRAAFRSFEHDHQFDSDNGGTTMTDILRFDAPFGAIGWVVERIILAPHLRRFLFNRALALKAIAENPTVKL